MDEIKIPTPEEIHKNAVDHGWWEDDRSFPEIIALCHSELSEALEEYRNRHGANDIYYKYTTDRNKTSLTGKPEGIPIELADCIIRIFDYCGKEGIDIFNAIMVKHKYNKTRPYRHGGKKC